MSYCWIPLTFAKKILPYNMHYTVVQESEMITKYRTRMLNIPKENQRYHLNFTLVHTNLLALTDSGARSRTRLSGLVTVQRAPGARGLF